MGSAASHGGAKDVNPMYGRHVEQVSDVGIVAVNKVKFTDK